MFLGYNTNGLAHHDLFDAVALLAEIGYRGVAITIDHNALPPDGSDVRRQTARLRQKLERLGMRSVVETGARFLLDPRTKHEPTLLFRGLPATDRLLQVRYRLRRRARQRLRVVVVGCAPRADCRPASDGSAGGRVAGSARARRRPRLADRF